jgi:hypothetical protein
MDPTCLDYRNYAMDRDSRETIIAGSSEQRYIKIIVKIIWGELLEMFLIISKT